MQHSTRSICKRIYHTSLMFQLLVIISTTGYSPVSLNIYIIILTPNNLTLISQPGSSIDLAVSVSDCTQRQRIYRHLRACSEPLLSSRMVYSTHLYSHPPSQPPRYHPIQTVVPTLLTGKILAFMSRAVMEQ